MEKNGYFIETGRGRPTYQELTAASMPLLELLNKYYCPHDYVIVTEGRVEVVRGDMAALLPVRD